MVNKYLPKTKQEALEILSEKDCYIVAGGSDLMVAKKNTSGLLPKFDKDVLYLSQIEDFKGIYKDFLGIHIKAMTTLSEVEENPLTPSLLKKAVKDVASSNVRHFATLVGNIGNASPAGDTIIVNVALNAYLKLESTNEVRFVKASDYILGVRKTDRKPDELITEIIYPILEVTNDFWYKVGSRKSDTISKVMVAGYYKMLDETITKFVLCIGSVNTKPVRSLEIERDVIGMNIHQLYTKKFEIINRYLELISPIDDQRSTKEYRTTVTKNILSKFIDEVTIGGCEK